MALFTPGAAWDAAAAPGIVRAGLGVVVGAQAARAAAVVECADDVVDGVLSFVLGAAPAEAPLETNGFPSSSAVILGVAALAPADVEAPFASGVMESVAAAMDRHARRHADVRFAWALLLAPGVVRACLVEPDAMHVTASQSTAIGGGGRRLLALAAWLAGGGRGGEGSEGEASEAWRLGSDPSMRWDAGAARWAITCPDDEGGALVVYARRDPLFAADTFFGRFTRCFAAALDPDGAADYVLKDSWQLAPPQISDSIVNDSIINDEIGVLRRMRTALAGVRVAGGEFQRLVCGGTVRVGGAADSSRLVLGAWLDAYARWTVAHGARRSAPAHRLHRRMVTGPVGVALHALRSERAAVRAVAGAMAAHAAILLHARTLHRDVSLGNVVAVRNSGMLIDFDHAVSADADARNARSPGHVGTAPFMSIANLEGLDVPRTALDDWEAALALLLCLAARPPRRDALCARLAAVGAHGVADFRRDVFACRRSLDAALAAFADPACAHALRLIRALHAALFAHPSCPGTARRLLRGDRLVDPILRRVHHAAAIHERCLAVVQAYLESTEESSEESAESALPKLQPHCSSFSSAGSGSTATLLPPQPNNLPPPAPPQAPPAAIPHAHIIPGGLQALRNKRKAHVDAEASPRVKRRKMTCDESGGGGFAPANFAITSESREEDSSTVVGGTSSVSSRTSLVANALAHARIAVSPAAVSFREKGLVPPPPPPLSSPKKRKLF
ncbi:hypothetical protein GGF38_000185 [Coemansia sp. RSA 25]|nr:hypothetical protein GGF38_000185 [Coemansia sp. RSA 25]